MSKLRQRLADFNEQEYDTDSAVNSIDSVCEKLYSAYDTIVEAHDSLNKDGEQLLDNSGIISSNYLVDKLFEMQTLLSDINEKLSNAMEK